ncbi:MAG: Gfo/Idh/MocA family oxidoreductase [Verrucomicrobia bacterium]|nr:Gfo/Idh/MocA family oxidoreductase [Verrucomicrobiota bacterium]
MKIRIGLIGIGAWGKNLARVFEELAVLHTVCDLNPSALQNYRHLRTTTSFEEILQDPALTSIAIAAPAKEHYHLAKAALEAGKDVFVEKPLCFEEHEAKALQELARQGERILMVGHILRYHRGVERLVELVQGGTLGALQALVATRVNLGRICSFENALWDFAPHDLSVILALTGGQMPVEVRCTGGAYLQPGIADMAFATFSWPTGLQAHLHVSWLNPFKEHRLTVVGSKAMAVFDDTRPFPEKLQLLHAPVQIEGGRAMLNPQRQKEAIAIEAMEPLKRECEHFLRCCTERLCPLTDGKEGLQVVRLLQAAHKSLETSQAVQLQNN